MVNKDYTAIFEFDESAEAVFNAVNDIPGWWSEDMEGESINVDDEFTVHFQDIHHSTQRVIESVSNKMIVWLVTESRLTFLKDMSEWNDTTISFEITEGKKTELRFTHHGLNPDIECFTACSGGWNHFLNKSLLPFIKTGKGHPNLLVKK